ncbi:hypothetical protein RJ639_017891 [Escallonia herrerae]|uniref:DC1 domain-containing protein n=1 Tax=Escallonia herrerae TaxID=1293975 RepID=A0AA89AHL5_9ASTE|nr:hypothetical protein RJ639_017891 [Escallonia herrerae]
MEYRHFSHGHALNLHEMPQVAETRCSGCNSPATGSVYVCWHCSFFLHEQCFRATRSLKHPSHPTHPLTLVPYPTYPSNSFFCNACTQVGTGLSYSCSDCEFDLHIQCAYSLKHILPSQTPNFGTNYTPQTTSHDIIHSQLFPNYSTKVESFPSFSPPVAPSQAHQPLHSSDTNFGSSYPPRVESVHTNPVPNYPIRSGSVPSFSPPIGVNPSTVPTHTHQPAHFSNPPNFDSHYTPQSEGIHGNAGPHNYSVKNESIPSFSPPIGVNTNAAPAQTHQPVNFVKPPNFGPNHTPQPETVHNIPTPNYSMQSDSIPNFTAPMGGDATAPPAQTYQPAPPNHFSHHHPLHLLKLQEGDSKVCSGCEEDIVGSAYSCTESQCTHFLHKSCFELSRQIQHESHPEHTLVLLSSPPYKEEGEFTCNACYRIGKAFAYHCSTCNYDLHVNCVPLPKTVQREDHEHPLSLLYSSPLKKTEKGDEDLSFFCDVCHTSINEICWLYYCEKCNYGTHSDCVNAAETDPVLAAQLHMQRLQLQLEMSRQNAQFIINMGQSLANLAG